MSGRRAARCVLAALALAAPAAAAAAAPEADADGPFELRAGPEVLVLQGVNSAREYSMEESGSAYGGALAGLFHTGSPIWVGLGVSYVRVESDDSVYAPSGSIGGWLLHVPVLVELAFPIENPASRATVGLELGGLWGGFENIYYSYTSDPTANVRGYFLGVRGGYVLSIADDFAVGASIGARAGVADQTNVDQDPELNNQGMGYWSLVAGLALHFQP